MKRRNRKPRRNIVFAALSIGLAFAGASLAGAQIGQQNPAKDVRIEQKLDAQAPLDVPFRDETGRTVSFGALFGKKPVVLMMPFFKCAGACTIELNGMVTAFQKINFKPGSEFNVVVVSIDPRETPDLAAAKKQEYLDLYGKKETAPGWHFLTGTEDSIKRLASAVGYHYWFDTTRNQYNHPTGMIVLTPKGRVSRYFYGTDFLPTDVRLGLMDASENKIGSLTDQFLIFCSNYDPKNGHYGLAIIRILQVAGGLTVLIVGAMIGVLSFKYRREPIDATAQSAPADSTPVAHA